jgi:predicted transcriptional regulator
MTAITLNLPDAIAEKLKKRDDRDEFATNVFTDTLEDDDRVLTSAEIDVLQERLAQAERGEVYSLEEFSAMMKANKEKILAEMSANEQSFGSIK